MIVIWIHLCTYQGWHQGLLLQNTLDCPAVDGITFLINNFPCSVNLASPIFVIITDKGFPLFHVLYHPEILKTGARDEASRTGTAPFIADGCQKNSVLIRQDW